VTCERCDKLASILDRERARADAAEKAKKAAQQRASRARTELRELETLVADVCQDYANVALMFSARREAIAKEKMERTIRAAGRRARANRGRF
jgi:hypothetical protein